MANIQFPDLDQLTPVEAVLWYVREAKRVSAMKASKEKLRLLNELIQFKHRLNEKLMKEKGSLLS